ncbi:site-specific DNA-methyltransferase [Wukongibacter sp. M2B1]|uniref:site-specific DNA-methyltransferase n=1 Tax=Wukongibacter sp. M2B1 TaxID=3088895 RepID=UPI003D793376
MADKQRLELTWIGKNAPQYDATNIEPRILIEDTEKSYGDSNTENMLIHGDNLLALKALEQKYSGKIKCIYIDPPYNTGNAFEHYDDNLEHSTWLNLMKPRLEILKNLLSNDGIIFIQIDDEEMAYLKVLCDEIFGRNNFITSICIRMSTPSGVKTSHKFKKIIKEKEYILVYSSERDKVRFNPQYVPKLDWENEFQYWLEKNNSNCPDDWKVKRLNDVLKDRCIDNDPDNPKFKEFVIRNSDKIWRRAFIRNEFKTISQQNPDRVIYNIDNNEKEHYYYRGREMYFYSNKFNKCFTENGYELLPSNLIGDLWTDINTGKLFNEGGVNFRNGKKPEFLIARLIDMTTSDNDIVLDSFLGSGTTAAVAHKMNRRWIGVELGEACYTHCIPRLKRVIDGEDTGGITKSVDWKNGGGFKFYELSSSLLKKDSFGNWIIDEKYNADMLGAAMCKHEGFTYNTDEEIYWKQGQSTEKDFIFITTSFLTLEHLDKIHEEMKPDESLLICCKAYQEACDNRYENITIKKIPQMILDDCEFGKTDYNLNIINVPDYEEEE